MEKWPKNVFRKKMSFTVQGDYIFVYCFFAFNMHIFLLIRSFSYFKIIPVGFVNTPKYLLSPDCFFKIWEKPSKFSKSLWLRWHCVCVFNNYFSTCPHSQRQCQGSQPLLGHTIFENIKLLFCVFLFSFFILFLK